MYILFRHHVINPNSKVQTNLIPEAERKVCKAYREGHAERRQSRTRVSLIRTSPVTAVAVKLMTKELSA